jgi:hypothetical protein
MQHHPAGVNVDEGSKVGADALGLVDKLGQ